VIIWSLQILNSQGAQHARALIFTASKPTQLAELELIQTQMAQKPMLRAEVYAHAMCASQNRKKEVRSLRKACNSAIRTLGHFK